MTNKFEKNTNCAYCDKPLDAKYRNKRFCNDKCRIYFKRESFLIGGKKADKPIIDEYRKPAAEVDWYKSSIITTEKPKEATVIVTENHSGETKKFKIYDYSAMPKGLLYPAQKKWKTRARIEQDKQTV